MRGARTFFIACVIVASLLCGGFLTLIGLRPIVLVQQSLSLDPVTFPLWAEFITAWMIAGLFFLGLKNCIRQIT